MLFVLHSAHCRFIAVVKKLTDTQRFSYKWLAPSSWAERKGSYVVQQRDSCSFRETVIALLTYFERMPEILKMVSTKCSLSLPLALDGMSQKEISIRMRKFGTQR